MLNVGGGRSDPAGRSLAGPAGDEDYLWQPSSDKEQWMLVLLLTYLCQNACLPFFIIAL